MLSIVLCGPLAVCFKNNEAQSREKKRFNSLSTDQNFNFAAINSTSKVASHPTRVEIKKKIGALILKLGAKK